MASSSRASRLTDAHRALQMRLLESLDERLRGEWGVVDPEFLRGTLDRWAADAIAAALEHRAASATAARAYYEAFRAAEGVAGAAPLLHAEDLPLAAARSATVDSAISGIIDARRRGASVAEARASGITRAVGSAIKFAADGGRSALLGAVAGDREAIGYQRVTDGDPCAWCRMIASRGIIRYSAETAGFQAHPHCGCTAEPAFEGSKIRPENAEYKAQWREATAGQSDALKAFRRYVAEQGV